MFSYKNICDAVFDDNTLNVELCDEGFCALSTRVDNIEFAFISAESIKKHEEYARAHFTYPISRMNGFLNEQHLSQIEKTKKHVDKYGKLYIISDGVCNRGYVDIFPRYQVIPLKILRKMIKYYHKSKPTIVVTRHGNIPLGITKRITDETFRDIGVTKLKTSQELFIFMTNIYDGNEALRDELIEFAKAVEHIGRCI